jgi:nucleotide-binding universal stress UspA family protein
MKYRCGERLHILHAYAAAARPFARAGVIQPEHRKATDELRFAYTDASQQLHFSDEKSIAALRKIADELYADGLAMGAISQSILCEILIGSTAEKCFDFFTPIS